MAKKNSPILDEVADENVTAAPAEVAPVDVPAKKTVRPTKAAEAIARAAVAPAEMSSAQQIAEFERKGREEIEKAPKVPFMCPFEPGEKPGAVQVVSLNGYTLTIKKGSMVEIPQPLAEILSEKYHVEMTAGENMRIDRDEKTENALM